MSWRRWAPGALLFAVVFGPKVSPLLDTSALVSVGLVGWALVTGQRGGRVPAPVRRVAVLLAALAAYSAVVLIVGGFNDLEIVFRVVRALLNLGAVGVLIAMIQRQGGHAWVTDALAAVYFVLVAHGALMWLMFVNGTIRSAVYSFADTYDQVNLNAPFLLGLRIPGLTYGLSQTSVVQGIGLLVAPALVKQSVGMRKAAVVACLPLLVLSMSVAGRTGFLVVGLLLPLAFAVSMRAPSADGRRHLGRTLRGGVVVVGGMVVALTVLGPVIEAAPGSFEDYTTERLRDLWGSLTTSGPSGLSEDAANVRFVLPEGTLQTAFGDGSLGRGDFNYVASDSGYVRLVFAIGLVGSLLTVAVLVSALITCGRLFRAGSSLAGVAGTVVLSGVFLNVKELALLTRTQWPLQMFLFYAACVAAERRRSDGAEMHRTVRPDELAAVP